MTVVKFPKTQNRDFYGSSTLLSCINVIPPTVVTTIGGSPLRGAISTFGCVDDIRNCLYVFASDDSAINDLSYFYVEALEESQTIEYRLEKLNNAGVFVPATTQNGGNTDGVLSTTEGTIVQVGGYANYPSRSSLVVDWKKIFDQAALGEGTYRILVWDALESRRVFSYPYVLQDFDCDSITQTIKIKWTYEGEYAPILSRGAFDAKLQTFNDEIRLLGDFKPTFEFASEETFVQLADGSSKKTQSKESEIFNLTFGDVTYELFTWLYRWGMKGKQIKVSAYNQESLYRFEDVEVTNDAQLNVPIGTNTRFLMKIPRIELTMRGNQLTYRNC